MVGQGTFYTGLLLIFTQLYGANAAERFSRLNSHKSFLRTTLQKTGEKQSADFCDDDDANVLTTQHVPGNCLTFNGHGCLCELNRNCHYDEGTQECRELPDCTAFEGNPSRCRAAHCMYDCGTKRCVAKTEIPEGCGEGCSGYCNDICVCQSHSCQYASDGSCQDFKQTKCLPNTFPAPYCGRKGSLYRHRGVFCKNDVSTGKCDIKRTIVAVNFGGSAATDSHGVPHFPEQDLPPRDEHQIKLTHTVSSNDHVTGGEAGLYKNIIYADASKRASGRCVEYSIPICEDGIYELVVKTMEAFDAIAGEKQFNVKLGNDYVFPEVDVMKLAGKPFHPIELIANFKVKRSKLTVDGGLEYAIKEGSVPLGFCYSECPTSQSSFQVAAFSVSEFITGEGPGKSEDCANYHGEPQSCRTADCEYHLETEECLPPTSGCSILPTPPEIPLCNDLPLDILFLLDSTSSWPATSAKESVVLDQFPRIVGIADGIQKKHPKARFGVALFSDFYCEDWGNCGSGNDHDDINGCYRHHCPLTGNLTLLKSLAERRLFSILSSSGSEPGFFASILALQDRTLNWTRSGILGNKVIILVTDDKVHNESPNKNRRVPAKFDGTDTCFGTLVPAMEDLNAYLHRESVSIYLLVEKKEQADSHQDFLDSTRVASEVGYIKDDTGVIELGVEGFIEKQLSKTAEMGGCIKHETPKCPEVELELLFLLDSSSDYQPKKPPSTANESLVFDSFQRIVNITDNLRETFPRSKVGIATFSEFACKEYGTVDCVMKDDAVHHNDPNGCYQPHQTLTRDLSLVKQRAQRDQLQLFVSKSTEPGYFGAMMAIEDCHNNWTRGNPVTVNKVIILMSDDLLHFHQANHHRNKTKANFDGSDKCYKTLQPSAQHYSNFFHREGVSFFFLGAGERPGVNYYSYIDHKIVTAQMGDMELGNDLLEKDITTFITELNDKKTKMIHDNGECERSCDDPPVEVVYLLDSTSSYVDKQNISTAYSLVFEEATKIVGSATLLREKFPRSRFGIALFSDFACSDHGFADCDRKFPGNVKRHDACDNCYIRQQPLTEDLKILPKRLDRRLMKIHFSLNTAPGLFGAVLTAQDCVMNWTRGSVRANKVIVIVTDEKLNLLSANAHGNKTAMKFDGRDSCCGSLQPSEVEFSEFFARERISIMLVVNEQKVGESYMGVLDLKMVATGVELIQSSAKKISEGIEKLIRKQIRKPSYC